MWGTLNKCVNRHYAINLTSDSGAFSFCPQALFSRKNSRNDFSPRQPMTDRASRAKWNPLRLCRHFSEAPGSVTYNAYTYTTYIHIYRYRQVSWKNRRAVRDSGGGRCWREPTKGCMIDRAMACQIMQFYFIWFRGGNCYFGGSAAPNGRRSDVLAWLFLPHCRLSPFTPVLLQLPCWFPSLSVSPLSFSVLRYILTPARIIAPRVEKSGSITCERRWRIVGTPFFRQSKTARNDKSRVFLPSRSGNAPNRSCDWFRSPDLPRFAPILRNAFRGTESSRWLRSYGRSIYEFMSEWNFFYRLNNIFYWDYLSSYVWIFFV